MKLTVSRALAAQLGRRSLRVFLIAVSAVCIGIIFTTAVLAYFFSVWWWLLLIPVLFIVVISIVIQLLVRIVLRTLYPVRVTLEQRAALDDFIDRIQAVIEARATPPWVFALILLKDLVVHKDIRTIQKLINDSIGLREKYRDLERIFS